MWKFVLIYLFVFSLAFPGVALPGGFERQVFDEPKPDKKDKSKSGMDSQVPGIEIWTVTEKPGPLVSISLTGNGDLGTDTTQELSGKKTGKATRVTKCIHKVNVEAAHHYVSVKGASGGTSHLFAEKSKASEYAEGKIVVQGYVIMVVDDKETTLWDGYKKPYECIVKLPAGGTKLRDTKKA